MHLSRLSEDLIIWSTREFGLIEFGDAFSTGSSLMPQKKNPDIAELTRGKTGRLYGNLTSILTTMKALPSSYNRDMQEDKEALFDSVDTIRTALEVFTAMLPELRINRERMEVATSDPNLFATDLAEYLVKKGMPFRGPHEIVGRLVADCVTTGLSLNQIPLVELKSVRRCSMPMLQTFSTFAIRFRSGGRSVRHRLRTWRRRSSAGRRSSALARFNRHAPRRPQGDGYNVCR